MNKEEILETDGRERFEPYKKKSQEEIVRFNIDRVYNASVRLKSTITHETPHSKIWYDDNKKVDDLISKLYSASIELDYAVAVLSELESGR